MHHYFVEEAIQLAYGESYKGYSIIVMTKDYKNKHEAVIVSGGLYEKDIVAVIGSSLAWKLLLRTQSVLIYFFNSH